MTDRVGDYRPARWDGFREDYRFTGKENDAEVGLTYFGKRFLAVALACWLSPDPLAIHTSGADPNLYAYVQGRVLKSIDLRGLDFTVVVHEHEVIVNVNISINHAQQDQRAAIENSIQTVWGQQFHYSNPQTQVDRLVKFNFNFRDGERGQNTLEVVQGAHIPGANAQDTGVTEAGKFIRVAGDFLRNSQKEPLATPAHEVAHILGNPDEHTTPTTGLTTGTLSVVYAHNGLSRAQDVAVRQSHIDQIVGSSVQKVDAKITQLERGDTADRFEADRLKTWGVTEEVQTLDRILARGGARFEPSDAASSGTSNATHEGALGPGAETAAQRPADVSAEGSTQGSAQGNSEGSAEGQ